MSLSIEVVDHILTFLDLFTLKTCARSHPILSKLSERYLYADITLDDDVYKSPLTSVRTSKFTQILAKTPDIANHVRSLTVICVEGVLGSQQHEATSSHLNGVASLLPMFARLTRLVLVGYSIIDTNDTYCFSWHAMPETFCQAFLHHSQVMKDILIVCITSFPMSLLNNCRNVRVTLECCIETQYDKESRNPEDEERSCPVPFEYLCTKNCSETCLENIAPWIKMHGLHSLEYADFKSGHSLQLLLAACSNSLTNLRINPPICETRYRLSNDSELRLNEDIVLYPFTLACLRHLTQFTISIISWLSTSDGGSWALSSPVPAISELISHAPPNLQKLSVEITFDFKTNFEQLPDPVVIWSPFIRLAAKCSSASISMYIFPSLEFPSGFVSNIFSPFTDYKGLTPYVERGVVVISEEVHQQTEVFDMARHSKRAPAPYTGQLIETTDNSFPDMLNILCIC